MLSGQMSAQVYNKVIGAPILVEGNIVVFNQTAKACNISQLKGYASKVKNCLTFSYIIKDL